MKDGQMHVDQEEEKNDDNEDEDEGSGLLDRALGKSIESTHVAITV